MMKFVTSSVGIGLVELLMTDHVKPVWRNIVVFQIFTKYAGIHQTSNTLERLNKEIKRRTAVATLFPNERSLMRLVTAILARTPRSGKLEGDTSTWDRHDRSGEITEETFFIRALRWSNPHRLSFSHYEAVSARHKNIDNLTHGNHLPFPQRNRNASGHIFRCSFGIQELHRHYVDSAKLIDRIPILDKSTIIYRFTYYNGARVHTSNNVSPSPSFARCQKTNLYFCIWNQKPSPTAESYIARFPEPSQVTRDLELRMLEFLHLHSQVPTISTCGSSSAQSCKEGHRIA